MLSRVVIAGGGTGGHVFPAIAIGQEVKRRNPDAEVLFIGALGKMEMDKVPKAGFKIIGLNISGFQRGKILANIGLPFKIIGSLWKSRSILKDFKPEVVVGVGGYSSGPVLRAASGLNIPTVIQEQNSYAGLTNKLLSKFVQRICVAYPNMEKYFPKEKVVQTGNPTRQDLDCGKVDQQKARKRFGIDAQYEKIVLVMGGSLGARSFNEFMESQSHEIQKAETVFFIWQMGKFYIDQFKNTETASLPNVWYGDFIDHIEEAICLADVVLTRAGAIALSELALLGKALVVVPSPHVVDDHQTKNAMAFYNNEACVLLEDRLEKSTWWIRLSDLIKDEDQQIELKRNIGKLASKGAERKIVDELEKLKRER